MTRVVVERMQLELEVDGDDRAVFARMFREHIEAWERGQRERAAERARLERDRSIHGTQRPGGRGL